ncbi:MAG TPA: DinB family protein, partial [bacterium]|nr:DinB family protein [bacterium]
DTPMNENFEKNADPKKATETIKASFALVRNTVLNMNDADMDKTVKFFGGKDATIRNVLFTTMNHQHEHLGQLIAYARANGITPPWSAN